MRKLMNTVCFLAFLATLAAAAESKPVANPGEIVASAAYVLTLDSPVLSWEIDPESAGTITPKGESSCVAEVTAPCVVTAWFDAEHGRSIRLGGSPPIPPDPTKPTAKLTIEPESIAPGGSAVASWEAGGSAKTAKLNGETVTLTGAKVLKPTTTTKYIFEAIDGSVVVKSERILTVTDTPPPDPTTPTLHVFWLQTSIKPGEAANLIIICSEPTVTFDNGVGKVTLTKGGEGAYGGTVAVKPSVTTKYTGTATNAAGKSKTAECTVKVDDGPPPVPVTGLTIAIVEDVNARDQLTPSQIYVLQGTAPGTTRDYANRKCATDSFGAKTVRLLDANTPPDKDDGVWKTLWSRPRKSLPWYVATDGTKLIEGDFGANSEVVSALTKAFGPPQGQPPQSRKLEFTVYGDANWQELIKSQPKRVDIKHGLKPRAEHPKFAARGSAPGIPAYSDGFKAIPRSEWPARIKGMTDNWAWPMDWMSFEPKDQDGTNFCWINGPVQGLDTVRVMQGLPFVEGSAASGACLINGYVNQGGWGIEACEFMLKTGCCSVKYWPNTAINRQYDNAASKADRPFRKVVTFYDLDSIDEVISCLLLGHPVAVGYNWWSHEVVAVAVVDLGGGSYGLVIRNSWGDWGDNNRHGVAGFSVLTGSKMVPDDAQAIVLATQAPALSAEPSYQLAP